MELFKCVGGPYVIVVGSSTNPYSAYLADLSNLEDVLNELYSIFGDLLFPVFDNSNTGNVFVRFNSTKRFEVVVLD